MKSEHNSAILQIKMAFITALVAVIGFAFISPFFDSTPISDSTPQVLVFEVQESWGDSEPVLPDTYLGTFLTDLMLVFTGIFIISLHYRKEVVPRLTFLYHIRPRSPPAH
ncbi:MAG: hypothetical protein CTY33_00405 [Methylotenera sp.]|nr:MAG: hypothetical protein CTY33_00405 [Methylotenera sp.]